ncbi:MAG: hypothetical protein EG824_08970 [Deltaproteobacteria bacterium]|nr:hypothetical protein [Deltaproteobacteria bacterium]
MDALLRGMNPLHYISGEQYTLLWKTLFSTILQGFWGRLLAFTLLFLSFWFGVRRRNFAAATAFFFLALVVTFAAPLLRLLGLL